MEREDYMRAALALAHEAAADGEVPVGCVIADDAGRIIGRGRNRRERTHRADAHAEMEAIAEACRARGTWRLDACTLYVTLEPCPMCRTFAVEVVDRESTAIEDYHYRILDNTVTIKAGETRSK